MKKPPEHYYGFKRQLPFSKVTLQAQNRQHMRMPNSGLDLARTVPVKLYSNTSESSSLESSMPYHYP